MFIDEKLGRILAIFINLIRFIIIDNKNQAELLTSGLLIVEVNNIFKKFFSSWHPKTVILWQMKINFWFSTLHSGLQNSDELYISEFLEPLLLPLDKHIHKLINKHENISLKTNSFMKLNTIKATINLKEI